MKAHSRLERNERLARVLDLHAAMADQEGFRKYLAQLSPKKDDE